jgi:hypothetical protein
MGTIWPPPPEKLRERIELLEAWATTEVARRGIAARVAVRPGVDALISESRSLIEVSVDDGYLADPSVPLDHLRFLVGHELGEAKLKLEGAGLTLKPKEHAADCFGAELVGVNIAVVAIRAHAQWHLLRGTPLKEDSETHPSTSERMRHLLESCSAV